MRTLNKSRNFLAYALLVTMALTCILIISGPTTATAEDPIGQILPPDTIPANGGGDTTGGARCFESGTNSPSTLDIILLIMDVTIY